MREHILIAIPTLDSRNSTKISELFAAATQKNFVKNYPYKFSMRPFQGIRGVAAMRNTIAQFFLRQDADRLWMIDDDIMPELDVLELLDVDGDIVAPVMPITRLIVDMQKKHIDFDFPCVAYKLRDMNDLNTMEFFTPTTRDVMHVDAVGFGCTIIRRHLLEDKRLWGETSFTRADGSTFELPPESPPPIFNMRVMPNGITELGEDVEFCYRAKKLGYSVKLHAGIMVGHQKVLNARDLYLVKKFYDAMGASQSVAAAIQ